MRAFYAISIFMGLSAFGLLGLALTV